MDTYQPQGALRRVFDRDFDELVIAGPAGTGKSRACLEYMHAQAESTPGFRGVVFRKTFASVEHTAKVTYEEWVLPHPSGVRFDETLCAYVYPNGSIIALASLRKPAPFIYSELTYVQEVTELTREQWKAITKTCRRTLADCNPEEPEHWAFADARLAGGHELLQSFHEDNPRFYDEETGEWTEAGRRYLAVLDELTGLTKERLRYGKWCRVATPEEVAADAARRPAVRKSLRLTCGRHPMDLRLVDEDGNGVLDGHIRSATWSLQPPYDQTVLTLEVVDVGIDVELDVEMEDALSDVFVARTYTTDRGRKVNGHLYLSKEPTNKDG